MDIGIKDKLGNYKLIEEDNEVDNYVIHTEYIPCSSDVGDVILEILKQNEEEL